MNWTSAIHEFLACIEGITVRTIPSGIRGLIDVAMFLCSPKHLLGGKKMTWLCCAYPVVVGYIEFRPCQPKRGIHAIHPCKWISVMFDSCPQHMLAVLIYP